MRPWAGSWRWITLVLLAWGTLLFYIGGHLVRDSEHPERSSRELSKILLKHYIFLYFTTAEQIC
uniref:Uncharacterized protein n=1 Tax=Cyprinodon variegatus TaxID=28743 RepID=A0A3Q2CB65_CYPVA